MTGNPATPRSSISHSGFSEVQRVSHPAQLMGWVFGEGCVSSAQNKRWGKHPEGGCSFSCWLSATLGKGGEPGGPGSSGRGWAGLGGGGPCRMHSLPPCHLCPVLSPQRGASPRGPQDRLCIPLSLHDCAVYSPLLLPPHQEVLQGRTARHLFVTSELHVRAGVS